MGEQGGVKNAMYSDQISTKNRVVTMLSFSLINQKGEVQSSKT